MSLPQGARYIIKAVVFLYLVTYENIQAVDILNLSTTLENDEDITHAEKLSPPSLLLAPEGVSAVSTVREPNRASVEKSNKSLMDQDYTTTPYLPNGDRKTTILPVLPILTVIPKVVRRLPVTAAPASVIELGENIPGPDRPVIFTDLVCGQIGTCNRMSLWLCEITGLWCHPCRCDEDCLRFGDCCPDKYNFTDFRPPAHHFSCVSADIKPRVNYRSNRFLMVDECNNGTSSPGHSDSCKTPFVETVPVYSPETKYHYKNKFCALCNDVQDTVPWPVKATCQAVLNYSKILTSEDFFLEAWQNPSCGLFAVPPEGSEARECSHDSSMVSECPADWADPSDVTYCQKYIHPVSVHGDTTYRNVFCAKCNGIYLGRRLINVCHPPFGGLDILTPYSQAQDSGFSGNHNLSTSDQCPNSQVFDIFRSKCRDFYCPLGKVIKNHTCKDLIPSAKGVAYRFEFALIPFNHKGAVIYAKNVNSIFDKYLTHIEYINTYAALSLDKTEIGVTFSTPDDLQFFRVFNITVKRRLVVGEQIPRSHLEKILVNFVRQGWAFYNEPTEAFEEFHSHWLNESTDEEFLSPNYPIISRTKHFHMTTERRVFHHASGPLPPDYYRRSSVYLPVNELMDCILIELSPEEFEAHGHNTGSITEKATGKVLVRGQYLPVGKSVRVCTNFMGDIVRQRSFGNVSSTHVNSALSLSGKPKILVICAVLSGLSYLPVFTMISILVLAHHPLRGI